MTEAEQARAWRHNMRLTMAQLAELTGYSVQTIFLFERGTNSQGKPHVPEVWKRYKLACLGVRFMLHFQIDDVDDWQWA